MFDLLDLYFRRLPLALEGVIERVEALHALMRSSLPLQPRQPPPDHFVELLVFGLMPIITTPPRSRGFTPENPPLPYELDDRNRQELVRVVGGAAGVVNAEAPALTLQCQPGRPVHSLELLVFCDVSKVSVDGLFIGYDAVAMNLSSGAPIGFARRAEPGQLISANVRLRK